MHALLTFRNSNPGLVASVKDIQREFYNNDYNRIFGAGIVERALRYVHNSLDRPFLDFQGIKVIEVGAGHGQHVSQTRLNFDEYVEIEVQNFNELILKRPARVRRVIGNAESLDNIADQYFDLLIATCLLPHILELESALINFKRVLKRDGKLSIYVPCEPGMFLRFVRFFTTKRRISKAGYNHNLLHWSEHRNSFVFIDTLIKHVFNGDKIKKTYFPFRLPFWNLNLYSIYRIDLHNN